MRNADIGLTPFVQLVYLKPGATNVDPHIGILVDNAQSSVPVSIQIGSSSPVGLSTTTVPSPLPRPVATPLNAGTTNFALSLSTLQANTAYDVSARVTERGCGIDEPTEIGLGSFTTK